ASSLGDRFHRERFMLAISLAGTVALAATAVAYFAGKSEPAIFALAAVVGVTSTLFRPALQAILPSLATTPEELIASNGATSTIESIGTLAGPLLAGALVTLANPGLVFAVAAAALLASALLLALVHVEGRIEPAHTDFGVLEGARAVLHSPKPRLIVGLLAAQGFVRGCLNVLVVVLVFKELHTNGGAVGYLTAALGVGGPAGAPPVVSALGAQGALIAVGAILPLTTLLSWGRLRAIDREVAAPAQELVLVDNVPMFAPLSVVAKEHVASKLVPLHYAPGEV